MSFLSSICPAIQQGLTEIYGANLSSKLRSDLGMLKALTSPQNKAGFTMSPLSVKGKVKKVQVIWTPRLCEDAFGADPNTCDATIFPEPYSDEISGFTPLFSEWIGFEKSDLDLLCQDNEEYRMQFIKDNFEPFFSKLNKEVLAVIAANFGNWGNGSNAAKSYEMINSSNAGNFEGEADFMLDMKEININDKPFVVGAGNMYKYALMSKIGCCNDGGIDMSQTGNFNMFFDQAVNTVIGANHFVAMAPGMVQLVFHNEFVDKFVMINDSFVMTTIVDPATNLSLDLHIRFDDCQKQWAIKFGLNYKVIFFPSQVFSYCDALSGVNFLLHGIATHG